MVGGGSVLNPQGPEPGENGNTVCQRKGSESCARASVLVNHVPTARIVLCWTENGGRALRVARAIETGVLSINSNSSVRASTPFGGFKRSGFGRELGMHGLAGYSEIKNVFYSTEG